MGSSFLPAAVAPVVAYCVVAYCVFMIVYRGWCEARRACTLLPVLGWLAHRAQARSVHEQLKAWLRTRLPGQLLTVRRAAASSNRTIAPLSAVQPGVDVSALRGVIEYDAGRGVLHVEPGLPMDELAHFCLARGLLCPIILEFPGITCGGAFSGGGIESSSHEHGSFADTVEEVDVVTGDGRFIQNVRRTGTHGDLFFALRNSYGTVGVLTRLAIAGVHPAPPLVHLRFYVCPGAQQAMQFMESQNAPPRFMDAVALSPSRAVVVLASSVAAPPPGVAQLSLRGSRFSPWFAWHLEDVAAGCAPEEAYTTLEDYLFRFDRGAFWMARHGLSVFFGPWAHRAASARTPTGPAASLRFLYAWLASTRQLYAMLHRVGDTALAKTYIVQDFILPSARTAAAFVDAGSAPLGIWPLWLCPVRHLPARAAHPDSPGFGFPQPPPHDQPKEGDSDSADGVALFFNVGVYGAPSPSLPAGRAFAGSGAGAVAANRRLEGEASALGGRKMLYAQSFYTGEEWWALFSRARYEAARERYGGAGVFPDITSKCLLGGGRLAAIEASGAATVFSLNNVASMARWYFTLWGELLLPRTLHPLLGITHTGMQELGVVAPGAAGRDTGKASKAS
jgi:delta24-sterol reductase